MQNRSASMRSCRRADCLQSVAADHKILGGQMARNFHAAQQASGEQGFEMPRIAAPDIRRARNTPPQADRSTAGPAPRRPKPRGRSAPGTTRPAGRLRSLAATGVRRPRDGPDKSLPSGENHCRFPCRPTVRGATGRAIGCSAPANGSPASAMCKPAGGRCQRRPKRLRFRAVPRQSRGPLPPGQPARKPTTIPPLRRRRSSNQASAHCPGRRKVLAGTCRHGGGESFRGLYLDWSWQSKRRTRPRRCDHKSAPGHRSPPRARTRCIGRSRSNPRRCRSRTLSRWRSKIAFAWSHKWQPQPRVEGGFEHHVASAEIGLRRSALRHSRPERPAPQWKSYPGANFGKASASNGEKSVLFSK